MEPKEEGSSVATDPNPDQNINVNEPAATSSPTTVDTVVKRKRGRPRKYKPDETPVTPLPVTPISSVAPLTRDSCRGKQDASAYETPSGSENIAMGNSVSYSAVADFIPDMLTVNVGEDVLTKVRNSQEAARGIVVFSANGTVSKVQLKNPNSAGALTYEGRFEILTLSGSFSPTGNGQTNSISDRVTITLACRDGSIIGGVLDGDLTVAEPVQVAFGSFLLPVSQQENNPEKHGLQPSPSTTPTDARTTAEEPKPAPSPSSFPEDNPVPREGGDKDKTC